MRKRSAAVLATVIGLALPLLSAAPAASVTLTGPPSVPGELIIALEPGVTDAQIEDLYRDFDLEEEDDLDADPRDRDPEEVLAEAPGAVSAALINQLERDARVEYAEPNYIVTADVEPGDPRYGDLWGL